METKLFEVRDRGTCMSVIAIKIDALGSEDRERKILRHAGYGRALILFGTAKGGPFYYDPYSWGNERTRFTAHKYVEQNWDDLSSGEVIDVPFILGESTELMGSDLDLLLPRVSLHKRVLLSLLRIPLLQVLFPFFLFILFLNY